MKSKTTNEQPEAGAGLAAATGYTSAEKQAEWVVAKITHVHNHTPPRDERESEKITARAIMMERLTASLEVSAKLAKSTAANSGPPTQAEKTANAILMAMQRLAEGVK